MKVTLTYFKQSGKYYSEVSIQVAARAQYEVIDLIYDKLAYGVRPGLVNATNREAISEFDTLIQIEDNGSINEVPHLIHGGQVIWYGQEHGILCTVCGDSLSNGTTVVGAGDGTGQKFAHKKCYDEVHS